MLNQNPIKGRTLFLQNGGSTCCTPLSDELGARYRPDIPEASPHHCAPPKALTIKGF